MSRLTLIITDARVERLQAVTHEDALREGCRGHNWVDRSPYIAGPHTDDGQLPQEEFAELWNRLHGPGAWQANPEVVVLAFKPVLANIETMKEAA